LTTQFRAFYEALQMNLPDTREKQGLRHYLPLVVLGILHKKSNKASIQRFMTNKLGLLWKLAEHKAKKAENAPQLGRIMSSLDWQSVNVVIEEHLGFQINCTGSKAGFLLSGDGKDLKGGVEVNSTNISSRRGEVSIRLIERNFT
jgi:hypothetical protein